MGRRTAIGLGAAAASIDLLVGVLTLVFTIGFSLAAFIASAFYDSFPMLIAGAGIIAGLIMVKNRSRNLLGIIVIIVAGLIPIAVLYDIARTIVVYGSQYIPFPLSLIYLILIVLPMVVAEVCGIVLAKTR